jgi:hypothetical protein
MEIIKGFSLEQSMGHKEFYNRINTVIRPILLRQFMSGNLNVKLTNEFYSDKIPSIAGHSKLDSEERYIQRLHSLTTEILHSYEALQNIVIYLSRLPFTRVGIAPSKYIQYQLESFFNEMYILRERMKIFPVKLQREFREDPGAKAIDKKRVKYICDEIDRIFKPVLDLRGRHVHENRYYDPELNQLNLLEMLTECDSSIFRPYIIQRTTRMARLNAVKFVKETNTGLSVKLDSFFTFFEKLVFKEDGSIRIPSNIRATKPLS